MARVLVTGAKGFIGRHLSSWLAGQGHDVCGLSHGAWPSVEAARWGVTSWVGGAVDGSHLAEVTRRFGAPDVVFHLAGGSSVGAALANPHDDFCRNVVSTAEILEWLRLEAPATRLVAVSSAAVYGARHMGQISEDAAPSPCSPYGHHKYVMEALCCFHGARFGLPVVIARPFSVFGAELRKQLLWDLCSRLADGTQHVTLNGTGDELRDWVDVRDVVRALWMISNEASPTVPVINIGTGTGTSIRDMVKHVLTAWPGRAEVAFSRLSRPGDPFSLVANPEKLRRLAFEWQVPLADGVRDYVHWFLRQRTSPQ